jgi:hypothetical protein
MVALMASETKRPNRAMLGVKMPRLLSSLAWNCRATFWHRVDTGVGRRGIPICTFVSGTVGQSSWSAANCHGLSRSPRKTGNGLSGADGSMPTSRLLGGSLALRTRKSIGCIKRAKDHLGRSEDQPK